MGDPMSEAVAGDGPESKQARTPSIDESNGSDASADQRHGIAEAPRDMSGASWVIYATLNSDDMTRRLCRIIGQIAVAGASIVLPLLAIVVILMVKAPADLKYVMAGGSTVAIWIGTWTFGRYRSRRRHPRQLTQREDQEINDSG